VQFQGIQQATYPQPQLRGDGALRSATRYGSSTLATDTFNGCQPVEKSVQFGSWLGAARKGAKALAANEANRLAFKGLMLSYVIPAILMAACLAVPVVGWCCAVPMGFVVVPIISGIGDKMRKKASNMKGGFINQVEGAVSTMQNSYENPGDPVNKWNEGWENAKKTAQDAVQGQPDSIKKLDNIDNAFKFFRINPEGRLAAGLREFSKLKGEYIKTSWFGRSMAKVGKFLRKFWLTRFIGLLFTLLGSLGFFIMKSGKIMAAVRNVAKKV